MFLFLALNRHSHSKPFTYHSELWADKSGYNVYLPALFIYDFNSDNVPEDIINKTGHGFFLDTVNHVIATKYPYGVALMQAPFWLLAHYASTVKDGYSIYYQKSIDIAGSFYYTLGLFFLIGILRRYQSLFKSVSIALLITLSTGIFYYGIFETGMSHVYSYCCLSMLVFFALTPNLTMRLLYLVGGIASLFVIIRPINILFLIIVLCWLYLQQSKQWHQLIKTTTKRQIVILLIILFCLVIPQFIYYKYAFDNYLTMSYQNEPFVFPSLARILELLFSSDNGLLIYYPVIIVLLFYNFLQKTPFYLILITLFLFYVVIYASWWSLPLGCGFGHRAFNDIAIVFFVPLFFRKDVNLKAIIIILFFCSCINVKFIFSYDTCLYNSNNWNFNEYFSILFGPFK